jgi:phage terminase large subunit-like protein
VECCERYAVRDIGYDPWNADAIVNPLESRGVQVTKVVQSYGGVSSGTRAFLDAIEKRSLVHGGNAVMDWCCGNAAADSRDDAIRFNKSKSADKIDGAVAAAMAFAVMLAAPEKKSAFTPSMISQ